jgi:HD-like signal output (HDOD) protein
MNADQRCALCGKDYRTEKDFLSETRRWRLCTEGNLWFNCRCGSTLMVKKGKFPWYSPEKALGAEAKGVFNSLGNLKDLPHIPAAVMELQRLTQNPETSPKELATAVKKEPVIAAQVLQIAENLRNTRNPSTAPIKALDHAIVYIGVHTLSDLLLATALRLIVLPRSGFDADGFWREAYLTGAIAEHVMKTMNAPLVPDEVYLSASLCNIGKLVTAYCFPPLVTKIAHDISDPHVLTTWRAAENSYHFPDHAVLGEIAATLWGLPEYVTKAARHHHEPVGADAKKPLSLAEIAAVANQLMHRLLLQPHRMESTILESFKKRVGITDKDIEAMMTELSGLRAQIRA